MQNEQEENKKPEVLYIANIKDIDPIEGLENATFYTLDFKDKKQIEDSETFKTFTMEFDGEIPEDAIRAITEANPVIVKGGKLYDKDMNLLCDGESIKDIKIRKNE